MLKVLHAEELVLALGVLIACLFTYQLRQHSVFISHKSVALSLEIDIPNIGSANNLFTFYFATRIVDMAYQQL